MEALPHLINDLAYILIIAGAVTIVFKRMRQPLVLGYIVAGFLAGPYMPYTPSISDHNSINDWSQIGVIFLMFTLGLEFSFKKIVKMGMRPVVAALCVMVCMISVGNTVGKLFGWSSMDCLFLGGMLAMSSTTIIYKAFDDLGLRSRRFASGVLSVLILEDILGILLMVMLSAMAVSNHLEGAQMVKSLVQLGFCLILWFIVGIYVVPLILRKYKEYINTETLLIVSVGLCFCMVLIASYVGYSPAFGAFMMGSILAETVEAERIEHTVSSLKDLFGAIFFVSVGMLVNPSVLLEYWLPIFVITLAVILGQATLGSLSYLVAGNPLREAMQSGFSMAQIGEFAFIIAALGQSLGVTSGYLYPVVVAVSIITTFFTPYMIKAADPAYNRFQRIIPERVNNALEKRDALISRPQRSKVSHTLGSAWKTFLRNVVLQTVIYLTLSIAIIGISFSSLLPLCRHIFSQWPGSVVCAIITLLVVSPCVRPIVMQRNHSAAGMFIRRYNYLQGLLYWLILIAKLCVGSMIVYYVIHHVCPLTWPWHLAATALVMYMMIRSRWVKFLSIRLQRTFLYNLRNRELQRDRRNPSYVRKLRGRDLHIASLSLPANTAWSGRTLAQLHIGRTDNVHVVAVIRGSQRINIPGGSSKLFPGDVLEVVGDDEGIERVRQRTVLETALPDNAAQHAHRLSLIKLSISESSPLCGKTLVDIDIRNLYHCMVVGIEDRKGNVNVPQAQRQFVSGDILWVVGEDADLSMLKMGI
ncbi:MAG: cation:proton antiporter [Bacteroidaceae bacterium]|nr:cation:proton antiporter [Bacteroidaceae bacterium]